VHVPRALPTAATHVAPAQQSALAVHGSPAAAHVEARQTNGGVPDGFGTQGAPLQQFALDAHEPPAATQVAAAQRATPPSSGLHVSWFVLQLPLQQSHKRLHPSVASLHSSPSGLHPIGTLQKPVVAGGVIAPVAGAPPPPGRPGPPQQSLSCVHVSPVA